MSCIDTKPIETIEMKFKDWTAIITGGGGGIGAAISKAFAEEGARVAVCDMKMEAAQQVATDIKAHGGCAQAWAFDVTKRSEIETTTESIIATFGNLRIWVNNAGISRVVPFLECGDDIWEQTMAVNLTGTYLGCQTAIRHMLPHEQGVILNMSSQSGKIGNSHYAAYCASKFGIIGLTQSLAVEFAQNGIRVNALCPGVVFTPLWEDMLDDYARKRKLAPKDVKAYLEAKIPMGRLCTPEDVARMAVFLASDDAAYMTGQAINLSGGSVMQ
jgi:NAD(P)-dependent dehydrogenase (short-subunit alcohol dehydrogenase family)